MELHFIRLNNLFNRIYFPGKNHNDFYPFYFAFTASIKFHIFLFLIGSRLAHSVLLFSFPIEILYFNELFLLY